MYDKSTGRDINKNKSVEKNARAKTYTIADGHRRHCIVITIIIIGHLGRRHGSWRHEPLTLIDAEARAGRRHMVISYSRV